MDERWFSIVARSVVLVGFALYSCSIPSAPDKGKPVLEVEPEVLKIGVEDESRVLMVRNAGDAALQFRIVRGARSSSDDWLSVSPDKGSLGPGESRGVTIGVAGHKGLDTGLHRSELVVEAEGVEAKVVSVEVEIGERELVVKPGVLDYDEEGIAQESRSLEIRNGRRGYIWFHVVLPGPWLTGDRKLEGEATSATPYVMMVRVDRGQVPWYGDHTAKVEIFSDGGDKTVPVRVVTETPGCLNDSDCPKKDSFCYFAVGSEEGTCGTKNENGRPCTGRGGVPWPCASGYCVDGVCCEGPCQGPCRSCAAPGHEGDCVPVTDGGECDDGLFCTVEDRCEGGECKGEDRRCEDLDPQSCATGWRCDEEQDRCVADGMVCVIGGECKAAGEWEWEGGCRRCEPEESNTEWTLLPGACFVDGKCLLEGQAVPGNKCKRCDPDLDPYGPSPGKDGDPCEEDGNECTGDRCEDGECVHVPLTGTACDDGNPCTWGDQCIAGSCHGTGYSCGPAPQCAVAACDGSGGCVSTVKDGWCLIEGTCYHGNDKDPVNPCLACKPYLAKTAWSPANEGMSCPLGTGCAQAGTCQDGACVPTGVSCLDPDESDCLDLNCDLVTGLCEWGEEAAGAACDDGNPCTGPGTCVSGNCEGGKEVCPCETSDDCKAIVASNLCLGEFECIGGYCHEDTGTRVQCEDPQPDDCLTVRCNPETGRCKVMPEPDYVFCDDKDPCTGPDRCVAGGCVSGPPKCPCDGDQDCAEHGDPCRGDYHCVAGWCVANPSSQVVCPPAPSPECGVMACDPVKAECVLVPRYSGLECDDGDTCTQNDTCSDGECHSGPVEPPECSISNQWGTCLGMAESCDPVTGQWTGCNARTPQPETCNALDDDCDGLTDEEGAEGCTIFYRDEDCDGWGVQDHAKCLCGPSAPCSAMKSGDCNDSDADVNPNKPEVCSNGKDDNCDGFQDTEGAVGCNTYYWDGDNDGFGVSSDSKCLCTTSGYYHTLIGEDCNDYNSSIYPGAPEQCNGVDDDCDLQWDENPEALCESVPNAEHTSCKNGVCTIVGCATGFFDVNRSYYDGCECQGDQTDPADDTCAGAVDLGNIMMMTTVYGHILPDSDSDWYRFDTGSFTGQNVRVRLLFPTTGDLKICVMLSSCSSPMTCEYDWMQASSGTTHFVRVSRVQGTALGCPETQYGIEVSNGIY